MSGNLFDVDEIVKDMLSSNTVLEETNGHIFKIIYKKPKNNINYIDSSFCLLCTLPDNQMYSLWTNEPHMCKLSLFNYELSGYDHQFDDGECVKCDTYTNERYMTKAGNKLHRSFEITNKQYYLKFDFGYSSRYFWEVKCPKADEDYLVQSILE